MGRQTASRWAGEALGICAPANLWHVIHPENCPGFFEGQEVVVLLLPQHEALREELADHTDIFGYEIDLPTDLVSRIDALNESSGIDEDGERCSETRGGAWPKGKAKGKAKSKAKAVAKPRGRPPQGIHSDGI